LTQCWPGSISPSRFRYGTGVQEQRSMSFIHWVIAGLIVLVVLAMLLGVFGVFFYDKAATGARSVLSAFEQIKDKKK